MLNQTHSLAKDKIRILLLEGIHASAADAFQPDVAAMFSAAIWVAAWRSSRAAYQEALALNPNVAVAHSSLGIMAIEDGLLEDALSHWRSALEADPREHAKLLSTARGLWSAGRQAEARPLLELFLSSAPRATYGGEIARVRRLLAAPE